jgi:hypothetical protein
LASFVRSDSRDSVYVSPDYFAEEDPFADFVVHEAAHIFHNCKRSTIGLRETRTKEWLLDIEYRHREPPPTRARPTLAWWPERRVLLSGEPWPSSTVRPGAFRRSASTPLRWQASSRRRRRRGTAGR